MTKSLHQTAYLHLLMPATLDDRTYSTSFPNLRTCGIEECGITRPDRSKRTSAETDGKSGISMVL